jgi:hypothetical protein
MDFTELTERESFGGCTVEEKAQIVNFMLVVSIVVLNWRALAEQLKFRTYQEVLKRALRETGKELVPIGSKPQS